MRHVAYMGAIIDDLCMGEKLNAYRVFTNNLNVRGCYNDVGTDESLALKCILRKQDECGLNSSGKPRDSC